MRGFAAMSATIVALTLAASPNSSGGWLWDLAQGLGFSAVAAFMYLFVETGQPRPAGSGMRIHQHLGWWAFALATTHAIVLLAGDRAVWQYLRAGAPAYMLAGIAATVLALLALTFALPSARRDLFGNATRFRILHWWLAAAVLGAITWHVVGAGFYLAIWRTPIPAAVLIVLAIGVPLMARARQPRTGTRTPISLPGMVAVSLGAAGVFTVARAL